MQLSAATGASACAAGLKTRKGWLRVGGAVRMCRPCALRDPELEERSARAPPARMWRECKMGKCASGPKGAARCKGLAMELATRTTRYRIGLDGKTLNNRA
eukprot:6183397-Pleurochrysis_carterae.AAC.7